MAAVEGEGRRHHGRSFPALSLCLLLLASTVWSTNADWCEGYKNIFNCILYHGSAACADNSERKPAFWCTSGFTLGAGGKILTKIIDENAQQQMPPSTASSPSPRTNLLL